MKLEVKNLEKKFNSFTAVNSINFKIDEGKTLGLLGPNGCGKTTTIGMLLGLVKPTGGKILIISFHSIEDKIVKYFFSNFSKNRSNPSRYLPEEKNNDLIFFEKYQKKVIKPSKTELIKNNSSRSAKLRFAVRSSNKFNFPEGLFKKFEKYLEIEAINA